VSRWLAVLSLLLLGAVPASAAVPPPDGPEIGEFTLTERSGRKVHSSELRGKVLIVSFIFTRCPGGCPQITSTMRDLQEKLRRYPDVRLITITVDPARDSLDDLRQYAARYDADPERWLFLTGEEDEVRRIIRSSFYQDVRPSSDPAVGIEHPMDLILVDRRGHIRRTYFGLPPKDPDEHIRFDWFKDDQQRLQEDVQTVSRERYGPDFPLFNATLNAAATMLLLSGYLAIRLRLRMAHIASMLAALFVSALFLSSYLYYHIAIQRGEPTRFPAEAPRIVSSVYYAILFSHIGLAMAVPPLALYVVYRGLRGQLVQHVRVARWTLPIWLYVSVTGVVVYWMLYRLYT
jgi:protein SCO1/2/putative membrane protein